MKRFRWCRGNFKASSSPTFPCFLLSANYLFLLPGIVHWKVLYPFLFENGIYFQRLVNATVQTYPVKTVTVYAFKNASLNDFFLNAVFRYSCWVKKREVFENVYVTVLDTSKRACSQQRCYPFSVTIAFSCGRAETIKNCKTWTGPKNTDT